MNFLHPSLIQCPYCWEEIEILVDPSVDQQEYVEDCQVCCRPIELKVTMDENAVPLVEVRGESD